MEVVRCNPANTVSFDVSAENISPKRKYPRIGTVRFITEEGKNIGSGCYKKYDNDIVCLTYMYVEPSAEYDVEAIYNELYYIIEKDIVADGYKTIFVLCDKKNYNFYKKKGYEIGQERDKDKMAEIMGTYVIHDITVEKNIY